MRGRQGRGRGECRCRKEGRGKRMTGRETELVYGKEYMEFKVRERGEIGGGWKNS